MRISNVSLFLIEFLVLLGQSLTAQRLLLEIYLNKKLIV